MVNQVSFYRRMYYLAIFVIWCQLFYLIYLRNQIKLNSVSLNHSVQTLTFRNSDLKNCIYCQSISQNKDKFH